VSGVVGTTFRAFAEDWTEERLHTRWPDHIKKKSSRADDRERLQKYVYPLVGHIPVSDFSLDHADAVMRSLPSTLAPATRRHVAQLMHRVLALAVYPTRQRPSNPLPRGFLPAAKSKKAFSYLYPAEDAQLLACQAVPLEHRLLYGFLAREGMRVSEVERLTWSAVDLERGAITLDENKTDCPRAWALDSGVVTALSAWRGLRESPGLDETVFRVYVKQLAAQLRKHLRVAGIDRPALFERSAARQPIRAHDLRATYITISLANGRTETHVQDRTGHTSSVMINRYRRAARSLAELDLGPLVPLDRAIPELRDLSD
jgi:integrase